MDQWINGSMDQWINGSMDQWINGSMALWKLYACDDGYSDSSRVALKEEKEVNRRNIHVNIRNSTARTTDSIHFMCTMLATNSQVLHGLYPHTTYVIVLGGPSEYTAQIVRPSPSCHPPTHIVVLQGPTQQLTVEGALRGLLDQTAVRLIRKSETDFSFVENPFTEKY
ncbi:hypothetical protein BDV97DRAFT_387671 [Delphinella strobiligena]|nr:hypothetical protein BDV97DRAFT_387671 [Delphinella strobiligena]